jgi:cell division protein FtsQ
VSSGTKADRRLVDAGRLFRSRGPRRRGLRLTIAVAVVVALGAVATWVGLGSSVFALRTVTVEGVSRVTVQQVLARAALPSGRSLFLVDPAAVAHRVERLAPVARADVTRNWPHTLVIHVVERRPAAVVVEGSRAALIDAHGVVFASAPSPPPGLLKVDVAGEVPGSGSAAARAAMTVVGALPAQLRAQVEQVEAASPDDISLVLSRGRTVVWGSAAQSARKARVLALLLRRHATRYDVSVPDVAVTG